MDGETGQHDTLKIGIVHAAGAFVIEAEQGAQGLLAEFQRMKRPLVAPVRIQRRGRQTRKAPRNPAGRRCSR